MLLASWHAAHSPSRGPAPARPYGPRVVRPSQIHTPRRSTQRLDRATRGRGCYQPPRHGGQTYTGGLRAARDAVAVFLVPPCSTAGAAGAWNSSPEATSGWSMPAGRDPRERGSGARWRRSHLPGTRL